MYDDVTSEVDDGIATVTVDRPEVHNAFTRDTIRELADALGDAADDDGVYAIVLTGADGSFCAGADVRTIPDWTELGEEEYAAFLERVQGVVRTLRTAPKPTVAAVEGPAIGAGCDFALACDVRFVGPDAVFREGFVRLGLVPGDGGAWLLPELVGESTAREYLLSGRDVTATDAVDVGLASDVSEDPMDDARAFAAEVRSLPRRAVARTKALIDADESFDEHCERAVEYQLECLSDPEREEAVAAFLDDREPDYDREYTDG